MTESGVASALQLMAAVESRELVGAVHSCRRPKCAEVNVPQTRARTEGGAAARETRNNPRTVNGKCQPHLTRGAASQKAAKGSYKSAHEVSTIQ
jgi:hypothetical protein